MKRIKIRRIFNQLFVLSSLASWGLAACAAPGANGSVAAQVELTGVSKQSSTLTLPTLTADGLLYRQSTSQPTTKTPPVKTASPAVGGAVTQLSKTPSPKAASPTQPTPSSRAAPVITSICSPLEFVALKDLPRIVSDKYNPPPMGSDARHQGVDFAYYHWKDEGRIEGTAVRSIFPGLTAASIRNSFPFGNLAIIETPGSDLPDVVQEQFEIEEGESLYVLYAHMNPDSPAVSLGETVSGCQAVGYVGKTGNTEAAHLHLETRIGLSGARFEVFSAFTDTATAEEKKNYRRWRVSGDFVPFDPMRLLLLPMLSGFSDIMGREKLCN